MRFLADECCQAPIVAALRKAGHDVLHGLESHPGMADSELAALAVREDRIVITEDYDFGELAVRGRIPLPGLIILAPDQTPNADRTIRLLEAVASHEEGLRGWLTIIGAKRARRRPLL